MFSCCYNTVYFFFSSLKRINNNIISEYQQFYSRLNSSENIHGIIMFYVQNVLIEIKT